MINKITIVRPALIKHDPVFEEYIEAFFKNTNVTQKSKELYDRFQREKSALPNYEERLAKESSRFLKKLAKKHPDLYILFEEMRNPKTWESAKMLKAQKDILEVAQKSVSAFLFKNIKESFEIMKKPL